MTSIMPCLWFDDRIDDAIEFYTTTFKDAKVITVSHQDGKAAAFTAVIELAGQKFMLLNGGDKDKYPFNWAVSFMIDCADQAEVDHFWHGFVDNGGTASQCGWCSDRFGLFWQVLPKQLYATVMGPDKEGSARAMQAMLKMGKLNVADLEAAYAGT